MMLLNDKELEKSEIVANNRMNRERNAVGINSYEKDIGVNPIRIIEAILAIQDSCNWLDLCCGKGKAILQSASHFTQKKDKIHFTGIDLVDYFEAFTEDHENVTFVCSSILDFVPDRSYDLITCVHGLHYVGDKLQVVEKYTSALNKDGLFVTHLDLNNLKSSTLSDLKKQLTDQFRKYGLNYNDRSKTLSATGKKKIDFKLTYAGANDKAGPNYTGQEAVDSYYEV